MTDNQVTLEPCPNPWCNSHKSTDCEIRAAEAPILMPSKASPEWAVACPVCPMQTPWFDTEAEALAAWNNRTPPAPSAGEVERVTAVLWGRVDDRVWNDPRIAMLDRDEWRSLARAALAAMDRAPGVWKRIELAELWQVALVTDGENYARAQLALSDHGDQYWAVDPEDGLDWEPTHFVEPLGDEAQPAPRPVEAGEVTQADRDFRSLMLKHIADSIERPCTDGDMIEDRQDVLDVMISKFRQQSLSAARAGIEGLREALEDVARELQGERDHLFDCCTVAGHPGTLDEAAKPDISRMDAALGKARAALSTDQGEG